MTSATEMTTSSEPSGESSPRPWRRRRPLIEIIPGKGSGQLKKRALRFLDWKEIKTLYDRVEKDSHNFGRVFVHFRWK